MRKSFVELVFICKVYVYLCLSPPTFRTLYCLPMIFPFPWFPFIVVWCMLSLTLSCEIHYLRCLKKIVNETLLLFFCCFSQIIQISFLFVSMFLQFECCSLYCKGHTAIFNVIGLQWNHWIIVCENVEYVYMNCFCWCRCSCCISHMHVIFLVQFLKGF